MPKTQTIHLNPPAANGKTRCGRKLSTVLHRTDASDITCNTCIRLDKQDAS